MKIKGKVHCFFEQSGTFKNEFIKLGMPAEDYDIQDNFGQTDHVIDLFAEIDNAYNGKESVFDKTTEDDLILAFYPCIYFCGVSQMNITLENYLYKWGTLEGSDIYIFKRLEKRTEYYNRLIRFCFVCLRKNIRMIFENPYMTNTFLKGNFIKPPAVIDEDRTRRGDYFVKPTAFWFFNCEPTNGFTYDPCKSSERKYIDIHTNKNHARKSVVKSSGISGICREERSMISPDYAHNFICDFILGKKQDIGQLSLF